ncbi:MAG: hypothetical protein KF819_01050 [Labilithrix sp.]|nr:hypothetical protein [Labilithrix sp.]
MTSWTAIATRFALDTCLDVAARHGVRVTCALAFAPFALLAGCARPSEMPTGTATVTGGTPEGVRVTNVPDDPIALRIADEMCRRSEACGDIGRGGGYTTIEACMSDQGALAPGQVSRWSCAPSLTQASFEACLVAIRSERCDTPLARADRLRACRDEAVCAR